MTTKPIWTEEEQFWRSVRRAILELVNAIETCKLSEHIDVRTAEMRKRLKAQKRLIGRKIILNHLLHEGDYPGRIIAIGGGGLCTVKLDQQEVPVSGVIYFDTKPVEVMSTLLQICYPAGQVLTTKAECDKL